MPSLADHLASLLRLLWKVLMAPLWFFDRVDKEKAVLAVPPAVRRRMLKLMFGPTLAWTMLLHRAMPDQRRWYDRVDERLILGALPLEKSLESLARVERVSGVLNMCDEFDGHASYGRLGITQLRLPTMDYCSPSAQQVENGLDFIRKQPPGGTVYCHCKAGRGRAGAPVRAATRTPGVADPPSPSHPDPAPRPSPARRRCLAIVSCRRLSLSLSLNGLRPPRPATHAADAPPLHRAGTMAMAYLITEKGMTPAQAQAELRRIRPHVSPRLWRRPLLERRRPMACPVTRAATCRVGRVPLCARCTVEPPTGAFSSRKKRKCSSRSSKRRRRSR